ncbi:NADH:ubiquinone oxidoreductase subunit J [Polymorphobacter glacialis]|uniref:NADH-quinone oxidoreductase subunit J n=1 Tax=Sandarakinorhabdus glacialis TaxID=1614636 RepID=A0A916ZPF7_9SPHN|nr:NADH-quinone oxidoreductase subunit J [Polymorphobacter glacialis]GGE07871.1 NADH:ubiquinone oxidoreductase subunit J [Polymorphobacter glacialis]
MTTAVFSFYLFATILLTSAVMVILSRNPVHSVLWLIVAFFNAAGLFVIVGAEFLAMLLIIVYVGAVAVLFLFVVMMLDIDFAELRTGLSRYLPLGLLVAGVILAEILLAVGSWRAGDGIQMFDVLAGTPDGMTNTQWIGSVLYTRYLYVFQAAGLVLLVAMIGAIVLTHRQRVGTKRQDIGKQVQMTPAKSVRKAQPGVGQGVDL